jgi:hypothetical protein
MSVGVEVKKSYQVSKINDRKTGENNNFNHNEIVIELEKIHDFIEDYNDKKEPDKQLGLPYLLSKGNFSELNSKRTIRVTTNLGKRIKSLKQKDKATVIRNVSAKAESISKAAGKIAGATEKSLVNLNEKTGTIISEMITEPLQNAREKIHDVVDLANKGTHLIMHIPVMATEAIGKEVTRVYRKAEKNLEDKIKPITSTINNVSKVIGDTVQNLSENISEIVSNTVFPRRNKK